MKNEADGGSLGVLVQEIKTASENIAAADAHNKQVLADLKKSVEASGAQLVVIDGSLKSVEGKCQSLETSINDLWKKHGRPGADVLSEDAVKERQNAIALLQMKHEDRIHKKDPEHPFNPTEEQIKDAIFYRKALNTAFHTADHNTLPVEVR
jgi:hypothetical protein